MPGPFVHSTPVLHPILCACMPCCDALEVNRSMRHHMIPVAPRFFFFFFYFQSFHPSVARALGVLGSVDATRLWFLEKEPSVIAVRLFSNYPTLVPRFAATTTRFPSAQVTASCTFQLSRTENEHKARSDEHPEHCPARTSCLGEPAVEIDLDLT